MVVHTSAVAQLIPVLLSRLFKRAPTWRLSRSCIACTNLSSIWKRRRRTHETICRLNTRPSHLNQRSLVDASVRIVVRGGASGPHHIVPLPAYDALLLTHVPLGGWLIRRALFEFGLQVCDAVFAKFSRRTFVDNTGFLERSA